MSSTEDEQQANGNGLAHQMQKRHSSGEHVNLQIKLQAPEELKIRRQSSPVLQRQHISLHHRTNETSSKPTPPPHPSISPELAKMFSIHKSRASNDIHVIDSRSKNAPQACNSSVPHKSMRCPPRRPDPPKQSHHTQHPTVPAHDPPRNLSNSPTPPPPSSTPPRPTPSPPPSNTSHVKSKRIPVRRAPPPPSDKASLKSKAASDHKSEKVSQSDKGASPHNGKASTKPKAASGHKIYDKVSKKDKASSKTKAPSDHKVYEKVHASDSSDGQATTSEKASFMDKAAPALRKISTDSKIGPLLEQFERACSNNKAAPLHMPGTSYYTDATKPQASSIPKSQSTDILSPEKTSVPKSQSIDLLSPTGSAIPKSQSTDLLKPQFPTSQSSIALKADQKTVIPKSQSSAALKSRKSSLPKQQNSSATKKESSSPKKESKKESASLKKESTSPKKESKKESTSPKKESKKEQKKESSPSKQDSSSTSKSHGRTWKPKNSKLQALFHKAERRKRKKTKEEKVAEAHHDQKDDHAKEEVHPTKAKHAKEEDHPTKAKHAKEEDHPTKAKHAKEEDYPTKAKHAEREFHPTKTKCAEEDSCPIEAIYALVQKINMDDSLTPQTAAALLVGSQTPGCWVPPEEIPPTSKDPNRDDELDNQSGHRKISLDRARFTVGSEYSSEDVYASLKKVRRTAKEEEIHPPLPPRLYENVFDDPIIAEQDNDMGRGAHHNPKAQSLQESMDNTYAVMHNPHSEGYSDTATTNEQEELPSLPPRLYENIFDDPIISEHAEQNFQSSDTTKHDLQESMDNTYAVMHNPRSQGNRKSGDQEELPPLPSKLYYVNIFDDPTAVEHKHDSATKKEGANEEELPPPLPPKMYENIFDDPGIAAEHTVGGDTAAGNTGSEQEEVPPPLPPKLYVNVFDDPAGSAKHGGGGHDVERGIAAAALTNGATGQESKAELQESADNTYTVMHNPRSKDKGESAGSNEQEDIYIVMHPHPAFLPMIKKHFKNSKSK